MSNGGFYQETVSGGGEEAGNPFEQQRDHHVAVFEFRSFFWRGTLHFGTSFPL